MFSRKVHDLRHFSFGDLVSVNSAFADAMVMDVQHDPRRRLPVFVEESLQHMDDKFHRGVVVIEQQHPVKTRFLDLRLGFRNDRGAWPTRLVTSFAVIVSRARRAGHPGFRRDMTNRGSHGLRTAFRFPVPIRMPQTEAIL